MLHALLIAAAALSLDGIEIKSDLNPERTLTLKNDGKAEQTVYLELGEDFAGEATLKGAGPFEHVRMTVAHTNVMSLHEEGPHLDLFDWLSYQSDELRVEPVQGKLATFAFSTAGFQMDAFPFVTKKDLVAGIKKQMKGQPAGETKRWIDLAQKCKTPQTYPCSVGVGRVILRVYRDDGAAANLPVKQWTLVLPQGC